MDKEFILSHLKEEHLEGHAMMKELCEATDLETVIKPLLMNCEQMNVYIPRIESLNKLIEEVIRKNKDKEIEFIMRKTGKSKPYIKNIIWKLKKKKEN